MKKDKLKIFDMLAKAIGDEDGGMAGAFMAVAEMLDEHEGKIKALEDKISPLHDREVLYHIPVVGHCSCGDKDCPFCGGLSITNP